MINPDFGNAMFEMASGVFMLASIRQILIDKSVAGVSIYQCAFVTVWSLWDLFFYSQINLVFSFFGSVGLAICNSVYVFLLIKYSGIGRRQLILARNER